MTIEEAKNALGKSAHKYTDAQIEESINTLEFLANIAIDAFLKLSLEEREKFKPKPA